MGINLRPVPRTSDGRERVQPVTLDEGTWHIWCGSGDTSGSSGVIGAGVSFLSSVSSAGAGTTVAFRFRDSIFIAGAVCDYAGAVIGDYLNAATWAPATTASSTPGSGNANKTEIVPSSGLYIYTPAAGDGSHTITLDDGSAHPVPNDDNQGYWSYTEADKGYGATSAGSPGASAYDLFDFDVRLVPFILNRQMLGSRSMHFDPENVKPTLFLPEWEFRVVLFNNGGSHTVEAVWEVLTVRRHTQ